MLGRLIEGSDEKKKKPPNPEAKSSILIYRMASRLHLLYTLTPASTYRTLNP